MKVYQLKKDWKYCLGDGRFGLVVAYKKGDRFFKPSDVSEYKTIGPNYYPENGGYAVAEWDDFNFVEEYFEFVEETDKPLEYFTRKIYTEHQLQEKLKTIQP